MNNWQPGDKAFCDGEAVIILTIDRTGYRPDALVKDEGGIRWNEFLEDLDEYPATA